MSPARRDGRLRAGRAPARAGLALALALVAAAAAPARADEPLRDGLRAAGRALALAAAARGEDAAVALAGPEAPQAVRAALGEVARAPRAADVRDLGGRLDLQAALLADLLAEAPGARAALEAFAEDAAGRLERELGLLEADVARLEGAAQALVREVAAGGLPSRKAAAARPLGPALLELADRHPVARRVLAEAEASPPDRRAAARYRALVAHFDREGHDVAAAGLVVLARTVAGAADLLDAVDGAAAAAALERAGGRIQAALDGLLGAAERALEASRRLRDEELTRVGEQARGPELEQAVRMTAAYRRQFKVPPSLRATRFADVYEDKATARVVVWVEGEDRWLDGPARVDPVDPVVSALLAAGDASLRARAADPRAVARLLVLWEGDGPGRPFADGLAEVVAAARAAAAALAALRDAAGAVGVAPPALDAAVLAATGLPAELLLGEAGQGGGGLAADAEVERRVADEVVRVTVERGPEAGRALARALGEAAAALGALAPRAVAVTVEGPAGAAVDLAWTPDPEAGGAWLVPPPARLAPGAVRAGGVVLAAGEVEVRALAWDGARVHAAAGRAARGPLALRLAPAAGPVLVPRGAPGPRGQRLVVLPLAAPRLALELAEPGADAGRPLAPAPDGAWAALRPVDAPGPRVALGRDVTSRPGRDGPVVVRLDLDLPAAAGVVGTAEGDPAPRAVVAPGARLELRVLEGGRPSGRRVPFRIVAEGGAVALERTAETLRWTADAPPGRYVALAPDAAPWPFAIVDHPPRVVAAAAPTGPGLAAHPAGAGLLLRVDAWPALLAEDVRRVRWRVEGGAAPLEVVTRPGAAAPGHALVLPVRLDPAAAPGARRVAVVVETDQGSLDAQGTFTVAAATRPAEVELRGPDGEALRAAALGAEGLLLRVPGGLERPTWVAVSPAGRARALVARFDGQAPLALSADDPPGRWEVWVRGTRPGGEAACGRLGVLVHPPAVLAVTPPPRPTTGERAALVATPPPGFRPPFRIRRDGGAWTEGDRVEVVVQGTNDVGVTLEDADGRRARGAARFAGAQAAPAEPVSQARYGIAANCTQRRLFAADHALLQAYRRNDNLPPDWVILEPGPLPAAKVRDRMFATLPYDGPRGADPQLAYRSKRFWAQLQPSAREGFRARGVAEGEPFDVLDSPAPQGEERLSDLAARLVAEQGAWEFRLVRARVVRAEGAVADREPPREPQAELRLFKVQAAGEGKNLARLEVPGPLGELWVAPVLPETLTLGRTERLSVSALARRGPLVAGRRYPGGWEALLPDALLCVELSVEVDVEGRARLRGEARHLGRAVTGADVGLVLEHLGADVVAETQGRPRRAERYRLRLEPFTPERPDPLDDLRFEPIWPGLLDNVPRSLVVTIRARLAPAVPATRWPEGKPGPAPEVVEGARVVLGGPDLPEAVVEVQATYLRQAPDGPKPWPATLPPLGAVRAGEQAAPAEVDGGANLRAALAALEARQRDEAEAAARQAVFARPGEPEPWAALADALLLRERPAEALATARWASALGPSARAALVAGEALLAEGDVDGARAAVKEAAAASPGGELAARLERLAAQVGE